MITVVFISRDTEVDFFAGFIRCCVKRNHEKIIISVLLIQLTKKGDPVETSKVRGFAGLRICFSVHFSGNS